MTNTHLLIQNSHAERILLASADNSWKRDSSISLGVADCPCPRRTHIFLTRFRNIQEA